MLVGHIVFIFIVAVLILVGFLRAMIDKREKRAEDLKSRTMPSGLILPEDDNILMAYKKEDIIKWDKEDRAFFVDYAIRRQAKSKEAGAPSSEQKAWDKLVDQASRARWDY